MKRTVVLLVALALLAGCASMRAAPVAEIARLPVVRVGEAPPAGEEYVVFYPAGHRFPARLEVKGTLFESGRQIETQVALARDLYLYKYWASHDGKEWRNSHELLGVELSGGFDREGAHAMIKLDAKP
jgi:hypothetical protein